jgi:hypothetical protein
MCFTQKLNARRKNAGCTTCARDRAGGHVTDGEFAHSVCPLGGGRVEGDTLDTSWCIQSIYRRSYLVHLLDIHATHVHVHRHTILARLCAVDGTVHVHV